MKISIAWVQFKKNVNIVTQFYINYGVSEPVLNKNSYHSFNSFQINLRLTNWSNLWASKVWKFYDLYHTLYREVEVSDKDFFILNKILSSFLFQIILTHKGTAAIFRVQSRKKLSTSERTNIRRSSCLQLILGNQFLGFFSGMGDVASPSRNKCWYGNPDSLLIVFIAICCL